jgi:tetratricopeptide (TPR) repeat protein
VLLLAILLERGFRNPTRLVQSTTWLFTGVLIVGFALLTYRQNQVWSNSKTLWQHTLKYNDRSYRAVYGYGLELSNAGDTDEAEKYYERTIEINPVYPEPHYALAFLRLGQGRYDEAIEHAEHHADLNEEDPEPHIVIGNAWFHQGDMVKASEAYRKAVDRDPEHTNALYNLANTLTATGNVKEAREVLDSALKLSQTYALYQMRASAAERLGDFEPALSDYLSAIELGPQHIAPQIGATRLLARAKRYDEALVHAEKALELKPRHGLARRLKAWLVQQMGPAEATATTPEAVPVLK